jgi:integrase
MWVEDLKNGKFRAVERYEDPFTGKTKRAIVTMDKNTAQTRKAAQASLDAKIKSLLEDSKPKEYVLRKLVEDYRAYQKKTVSPATYRRNYFAGESIKTLLGEETLVNRLNARFIRNSLLETGKEPGTLNEYLKRIKALLRWGYENDLIEDVSYLSKLKPFKDTPHRQKIEDKYLESEELQIVLKSMKIKKWRLLTKVMALSGMRVGEVIALELSSDIDFKNNIIHVNKNYSATTKTLGKPKTSCSIRDIYMQDELKEAIKELKVYTLQECLANGIKTKLLLCASDGSYVDYYSFNKYFKELTQRTIGRALTTHSLRHTHASLLLEQGMSIDAISRRLGHENSKVTREIYLHVTERLKEKENEQLKNIRII